ncbi:MAG: HEPN domain protein [Candidatus Nomurabacteria bacterium GW2011_GWA1_46_11]|uniref:HEPN domain protein n=1 Tax=Candidatus Nomurabacteria bacterium GW2011_GWA1_46_11 TaxID=1618732 RepID=A0A0G1QRH6_9BACT|nr:MAG: HEPN domain protein [Microgenomates group bacterium GW2011_GWA2_44_7]KKT77915.1 MAG: HEPN domain protein [Microgenomates group bacterium GW2011_GWB1_44_8]KKU20368.1 MAG: HEPN domain protein [Candidatus Nomurabacteria bacterium GW2011_GWA1_46_11]
MGVRLKDWERWLQKAKEDLRWSRASLKEGIYYGVCFAAQQAAEKALKAYLLSCGQSPRRIHDLVGLLEDCIEKDKTFEGLLDQAAVLSGYYAETRYPDIGEFMGYSKAQAEEASKFAEVIINFVDNYTH